MNCSSPGKEMTAGGVAESPFLAASSSCLYHVSQILTSCDDADEIKPYEPLTVKINHDSFHIKRKSWWNTIVMLV